MRKQIGIKLPEQLIDVIDLTAKKQFKDRTRFIEEAIREKLNSLKIKVPQPRKDYGSFSVWGWDENSKRKRLAG